MRQRALCAPRSRALMPERAVGDDGAVWARGSAVAADSVEPERRHWIEHFRAALLRKFIVPEEHVSLKLVVRALRLCNYSADSRLGQGAAETAGMFTNGMIRDRASATFI